MICFCLRPYAQEKLFRDYSVKEGLASNTVYKVIVDKKGFLWFGTEAGVSMFDGTTFTNFSANDGLIDNDVFGLFEDNGGRIWFLCFDQQPCYYYQGKFFNANNFKELKKIKNYDWHTVFKQQNDIWFSGKQYLYRFKDNKITQYSEPNTEHLIFITEIDSTIYAVSDSAVRYFNNDKQQFELYPGLKSLFDLHDRTIDIGKGQIILIKGKEGGKHTSLCRININPAKHTVVKGKCIVYDKEIINNTFDKESNVLRTIFTDNTVIERDILSDSLPIIAQYKLNSFASYIATDKQGNRWVTFLHGGIEMFPGTGSNKILMPVKANNPSTYYSIAKVDDEIIVGNNTNTLFFLKNGVLQKIKQSDQYAKNSRVIDMKMDKHNKLWIGRDDGICIYDPAKKKFYPINIPTNVKDIKYDSANDMMLFASTWGPFSILCKGIPKRVSLSKERTTSIAGSLSDTCWFATLDGLYFYSGKTSRPETSFSTQFKSRVTCLETDKNRRLWVGTSSNGVFLVQNNEVKYHFSIQNGLSSNICKNIFIDEYDEAWISTNLGVSRIRIDKDCFAITIYNDKNCLVDNNVNDVLVVKDTVYVVSSTGIAFFSKNNITNNYLFPVYITKIKAGDSELATGDSVFKFSSKQNTLSISFSGLSYLSNGEIKYKYYIEGLNDEPVFTKNNSVTYSKLSPGIYNFYVSATDVFGNKSNRAAHIQFTIVPQWYQIIWLRWLAILAIIVVAVIVTFKYSKQYEKRKRLRSELQQTISRLELEAIHSQINPHFIFNCLNAIQSAIYKNNVETANYFITRFAKLMRQALMLSKESFISIEEEYNFISNYLEVEKLRHNNSFEYSIEIDNSVNKSSPSVPAFVLQPFIENSINHGIKYLKKEKGSITLRFIKTDKLQIELDDNGIGINAANKINQSKLVDHNSKGIMLMNARIKSLNEIYNRNIQIKIIDKQKLNDDTHGTTVIISLDLL